MLVILAVFCHEWRAGVFWVGEWAVEVPDWIDLTTAALKTEGPSKHLQHKV